MGCHFLLHDVGIEPTSLASPASAGGFFASSATWAARSHWDTVLAENGNNHDTDPQFLLPFPFSSVTPAPPLHGLEFEMMSMKYWRRMLCTQQCGSGPLWWKQPPTHRPAPTAVDIPEGKGTFSQSKHSERLAVGLGVAGLDCSVILPALEKNAFPVPSW